MNNIVGSLASQNLRKPSALNDFMKRMRKNNSQSYTVSASLIKADGSDAGRVVVIARDDGTGEIVDKSATTLQEAMRNGVLLPDPLSMTDPHD